MKLSDTQLILLSKAAHRDDRVVELPSDISTVAAEKLVSKLAGAGLIEEIEAGGALPVWRHVNDAAFALRVTNAGLEAIGVDGSRFPSGKQVTQNASVKAHVDVTRKLKRVVKATAKSNTPTSKPKAPVPPKKSKGTRQTGQTSEQKNGTKHGQILDLLRRKQGAALEEMQKVTGWQAHSVRGFLSGTVKNGWG